MSVLPSLVEIPDRHLPHLAALMARRRDDRGWPAGVRDFWNDVMCLLLEERDRRAAVLRQMDLDFADDDVERGALIPEPPDAA